jgi:predicted TPR repeat methyltransferase
MPEKRFSGILSERILYISIMDKNRHTVEVYNQHVDTYVHKFMDLGLYKDTFDPLLKHLPTDAQVLELGCGPGNVVKYLKSNRVDLHIKGIDLAPQMIVEAQVQNPGVSFEVMDIKSINTIETRFNAIVAAFCLPYMEYDDAPGLFRDVSELLEDDGIFYLSCMEGVRERSGFEKTSFTGDDEMYINYYPRKGIEAWLNAYKFEIISFQEKGYQESDGTMTIELFFTALKRKFDGR